MIGFSLLTRLGFTARRWKPPTAEWVIAASWVPNDYTSSSASSSVRMVIAPPAISLARGTEARVTFRAHLHGLAITDCYIGHLAGGSDCSYASAPTKITFNSGQGGFDIGGGATLVSDPAAFAYDGRPLVIAFHLGSDFLKGSLVSGSGALAGYSTFIKDTGPMSESSEISVEGYPPNYYNRVAVTTVELLSTG